MKKLLTITVLVFACMFPSEMKCSAQSGKGSFRYIDGVPFKNFEVVTSIEQSLKLLDSLKSYFEYFKNNEGDNIFMNESHNFISSLPIHSKKGIQIDSSTSLQFSLSYEKDDVFIVSEFILQITEHKNNEIEYAAFKFIHNTNSGILIYGSSSTFKKPMILDIEALIAFEQVLIRFRKLIIDL